MSKDYLSKLKKGYEKHSFKITIVILIIGIFFIATSIFYRKSLSEEGSLFLTELGIAFIVVSLAETFILKSATREMDKIVDRSSEKIEGSVDRIVTESSDKIKKSVVKNFPIVGQAEKSGIDAILESRYKMEDNERLPTQTIDHIKEYIESYVQGGYNQQKYLRVFAISSRDFLAPGGAFSKIFWDLLEGHIDSPNELIVQILIMNRYGNAVKERAAIEHGKKVEDIKLEKTTIFSDLHESYDGIKHF